MQINNILFLTNKTFEKFENEKFKKIKLKLKLTKMLLLEI